MTDLLSSRPRSKDTTPKNFWTLLLFKINEMEARLFSLRKFWTSWYIHVSGNIWRKIPENCKVGAMKLARRKPGREKTFWQKKFETKHISVSKTRWSFYQSIFISCCFSFLISNTHQHTKCKLELALIYLHSIYFSFKNYFEDSHVWGSSFFASARLHHKFWIHSPNITNVAWFQSLESRRSCPGPQDSCRQRLHWQFFSGQFISMRGPRMIRPWKIRIQRRFSRKCFYQARAPSARPEGPARWER